MADEILENEEVQDTNQMYLDEIKNLKRNSVSKEDYLKLQEENRNLLKTLVEGQTLEATAEEVPSRSINEILKDFEKDQSNLDYIKHSLELHDKRMEEGFNDYLPVGHQIAPTDEDIAAAKQVEDYLRDLINRCGDDPIVFNNEMQRTLVDPVIPRRKK